jgi:class 3 adenylate cyclase/tetratricopeptide (TPR) repeat protein
MRCTTCHTDNREGRRFCSECGSPLSVVCSSCGGANEPGDRFCGDCGTALNGAPATSGPAPQTLGGPSERRLVSVLFADLVGFTTLSEHRDPEAVRELLSHYFDRCRSLIERHGGTVGKFIGDAVMAVWGTPVAREDDAERAVRAALALTQAVTALGEEVGMPELRVRAGIFTGSAAVDVGADSEGMVLGDSVNTASRLQSIAAPGTVLVDDVTRRATEAAVAYDDAGVHQLKGREQPVHAWTALRVVAGVGGARRGTGLEPPFVGRDGELATIISSWEESTAQGRTRLVSVLGEAGAGKSRLLWEFFKHCDGVRAEFWWHEGRCLSYGEGVGYWALAEMIRGRAGIAEEEDPVEARAKLAATVVKFVPDERDRRLVEPRLAHLLGLEQRIAPDRADLFSGWRLFFERMADADPVILVFEDLQWADTGLLDFIDYLIEWSADFPIFILAIARPELAELRPALEPTIRLAPLRDDAMRELLRGTIPGIPEELAERVLERAEGVPLYAVETVRMLLDRGLLTQDGASYVLTGEVGDLDVPETLHALVAARLDGLDPAERAILQDAAVLGQSFVPAAVAALSGQPEAAVGQLLERLVSKQVLALNDDKRSAERGQYHFLQGLVRTIAYGTLSRKDRKARHLAAARHLQETWGPESADVAEVLASHFLAAANADPEASDAPTIRASARETLAEAGGRAISLALGEEAGRLFDHAAELAEDDLSRAELLEQAGRAALLAGHLPDGRERLEAATAIYEAAERRDAAARATGVLAEILALEDRLDEAIELAQRAHDGLSDGTFEKAVAAGHLAKLSLFAGDDERALEAGEAALRIAEPLQAWDTIAESLLTRGAAQATIGRREEARTLLSGGLGIALEHDLPATAMRAHHNLAWMSLVQDRYHEALEHSEQELVLARARGDKPWESRANAGRCEALANLGRWDEALELAPLPDSRLSIDDVETLHYTVSIRAARGELSTLGRIADAVRPLAESTDFQLQLASSGTLARAALMAGRAEECFEMTRPLLARAAAAGRWEVCLAACDAAIQLRDEERLSAILSDIEALAPVERTPFVAAEAARVAGALAALRDDPAGAEYEFARAASLLRDIGRQFELAVVMLEHAQLLADADRLDEAAPLLRSAHDVFERLRATPWIERAQQGATVAG